jgi:hypothetical protein
MVRRLTLDWLIGAFGGFDHYPTGRDLVILGPQLAVKTQGEALVDRMGYRLWGGCRCPIRGIRLSKLSAPADTFCRWSRVEAIRANAKVPPLAPTAVASLIFDGALF